MNIRTFRSDENDLVEVVEVPMAALADMMQHRVGLG